MKKKLLPLAILCFAFSYSQSGRVGINNSAPNSTLDVTAKLGATDIDGMQAPRLTRAELTAKGNTLYGVSQSGALVYITDVSGGDTVSQRMNVTSVGYYYFDGSLWNRLVNSDNAISTKLYISGMRNQANMGYTFPAGNSVTPLTWVTETVDIDNAFNPTTGIFTAPKSGMYTIDLRFYADGKSTNTGTLGDCNIVEVNVNGSFGGRVFEFCVPDSFVNYKSGIVTRFLNAGDEVSFSFRSSNNT